MKATLQRRTITVKRSARSFGTHKQTNILLLYDKGSHGRTAYRVLPALAEVAIPCLNMHKKKNILKYVINKSRSKVLSSLNYEWQWKLCKSFHEEITFFSLFMPVV